MSVVVESGLLAVSNQWELACASHMCSMIGFLCVKLVGPHRAVKYSKIQATA